MFFFGRCMVIKKNGRNWLRIGWVVVELDAWMHHFMLVNLWRREAWWKVDMHLDITKKELQ